MVVDNVRVDNVRVSFRFLSYTLLSLIFINVRVDSASFFSFSFLYSFKPYIYKNNDSSINYSGFWSLLLARWDY